MELNKNNDKEVDLLEKMDVVKLEKQLFFSMDYKLKTFVINQYSVY